MWPNGSFRLAQLPGSRQHCHGNRLFLPLLLSIRLACCYLIRQRILAACHSDNGDVRGQQGATPADTNTHTHTHTHTLKMHEEFTGDEHAETHTVSVTP